MKSEQELKAKAAKYFERSNSTEVHITEDGMMFARLEHARSHKAGTEMKIYTFNRKDIKGAAPAKTTTNPATKEEALDLLMTIEDLEKADYNLVKTLGGLLEVSVADKKKATLITALTDLKNNG